MTVATGTRELVRMFRALPTEEQVLVLSLTRYCVQAHRAPAEKKRLVQDVIDGKRGADARLRAYRRQRRAEIGGAR